MKILFTAIFLLCPMFLMSSTSTPQPFSVELLASISSPHQSQYSFYPNLKCFADLKPAGDYYKVLQSDTNLVLDCGGHYYNIILIEHPYGCPACMRYEQGFREEYEHLIKS